MPNFVYFLIAGAFGSLAKDIVQDNKLVLPKKVDNELVLGFIGSMIVGAFVGWAVDSSPLTALLSGYVGASAIKHLLPSQNNK